MEKGRNNQNVCKYSAINDDLPQPVHLIQELTNTLGVNSEASLYNKSSMKAKSDMDPFTNEQQEDSIYQEMLSDARVQVRKDIMRAKAIEEARKEILVEEAALAAAAKKQAEAEAEAKAKAYHENAVAKYQITKGEFHFKRVQSHGIDEGIRAFTEKYELEHRVVEDLRKDLKNGCAPVTLTTGIDNGIKAFTKKYELEALVVADLRAFLLSSCKKYVKEVKAAPVVSAVETDTKSVPGRTYCKLQELLAHHPQMITRKLRAKTGYNMYIKTQFDSCSKSNKTNSQDLMVKFSKGWKVLSETGKQPFLDMACRWNRCNIITS